MNEKKLLLVAFLLVIGIFGTGCPDSKTVVTKVEPAADEAKKQKLNGVFYALPQTIVRVSVPLKRKDLDPGKYAILATVFFPGEDYLKPNAKGIKFSMGVPQFETAAEPDPKQIYMVETIGGRLETKTMLLDFTPEGVLSKADTKSEDQTLEFTTGVIKSAASIIAPFLPLAGDPTEPSPPARNQDAQDLSEDTIFMDTLRSKKRDRNTVERQEIDERVAFYQRLGREERDFFKTLSEDEQAFYMKLTPQQAAFYRTLEKDERLKFRDISLLPENERDIYRRIDSPYFRAKYLEQSIGSEPRRLFAEAYKIYQRIQELKKKREERLTQTMAYAALPPETLKEVLKQLDDMITELKNVYFLGITKTTENSIGTFQYVPPATRPLSSSPPVLGQREPDMYLPLFEFSPTRGVCSVTEDAQDRNRGIKVPDKFYKKVCKDENAEDCKGNDIKPCDDTKTVKLRLIRTGDQFSNTLQDAKYDDKGKRGFYYRIPSTATAKLFWGDETTENELGRKRLSIAQLGVTASLPATTRGRRTSYALELYPDTGALKNFNMGSDAAVQKSAIDDLSGAATTVIEEREKQKAEKEAKKPDELKELERQRQILEERNKILDEEEKLNKRSSTSP